MSIIKLINSEGQLVSTPEDILHEEMLYYDKLYISQRTSTNECPKQLFWQCALRK